MNKVYLLYKENYNDDRKEIASYNTLEDAEKTAKRMIEIFKYWGGGAVPCSISVYRGKKEIKYIEYKAMHS